MSVVRDARCRFGRRGRGSASALATAVAGAATTAAQGRGIGRALLDAAIDEARTVGARKLALETFTDNARAIALYVSAGFEVEGLKRRHYVRPDGSVRSSLVMGMLLEQAG